VTEEATSARDILTQEEAEGRAARISNVTYRLTIDITKGSPTYRGNEEILFDLLGNGDTFLCHRGKSIERLEINGSEVNEPAWDGFRLTLPGNFLRPSNVLRIDYTNDYDHTGDGFHQFIDPEDGEEYLYTNFEPYEAHRLFPCFDQPDIKATYALTVTAPTEWEVVANSPEASRVEAGGGRTTHTFAETKRFSTYLFAIVCGPYHVAREEHHGISMGLFCRKSLAKFLDTEELFAITRQGLDFYASFFDYPYPWGKYDQLFVPEFNAGAMENVGAVTHNEYMVFRDPPTDNQRRRRAETVLHEMAHMWFGDLVTMRWWNDLWLNESFATYMSYLCLDEATRFRGGWQDFNAVIKNWAYRQDQLVTTHPIAGQVADTDQTFLNFDGITYGKGASVLKQLVRAIGMDGFREGMRHYFRTHEFGNTTLAQFLASLEAGSGRSLAEWSRLWLETPSLNTLSAEVERDGERIASLTLKQTAPADYPTIRPHALDIGLYRGDGTGIAVDVLPANIAAAELEMPEARGKPAPDLVLPNHGDHAFAKVRLDDPSVEFLRQRIQDFDDLLTRQLLWSALWNMVRDQQLKSTEFLALVREKLPLEPSIELTDNVLNQALSTITRFVPGEWREDEAHRLFGVAWDQLHAVTSSDARIVWARAVFGSAITPEDVGQATKLMDGDITVEGLTVDQQMRWSVVTKHCGMDLPGARTRLDAETQRDPSDRGQRAKTQCEVSFPSPDVKAAAWQRFHGEGYGSLYLTTAAMGGFNWWRQRVLLAPYVDQFFANVTAVFERPDKEFATTYFDSLFPGYRAERSILDQANVLLNTLGGRLPLLERKLREAADDLERAIKCQEFARS